MKRLVKKLLSVVFAIAVCSGFALQINAQNSETVLVLPFENNSGKPEFGWVGESFADSLCDLLKTASLSVITNEERKLVQQRLNVPLTTLPSLATAIKMGRDAKASLLVSGKYNITPQKGDVAASLSVSVRVIRVNEGRFVSEIKPDGTPFSREIVIGDALGKLQDIEGQLAYQIHYQLNKSLEYSQNDFINLAKKVPSLAFEAYIKGLLTAETDDKRENYFKNAIRLYSDAKNGETYTDAALELGHFYWNKRKLSEAIEYFSRIPRTDQHYAESAFYIGIIEWNNNDYEPAMATLRPLADELKLTTIFNTVGAIGVQASRAEKKNKAKSAGFLSDGISYLKQASETVPDDPTVRFNYGLALYLSGKFADAAAELRPVLASNPSDGDAYFLLAKCLNQTGDTDGATAYDNQARRFMSNYAKVETDFQKSKSTDGIAVRLKQPARKDFVGIVLLKKAIAPPPTQVDETEALLVQARDFYKDGRDDEAMTVLRRVLTSEPMSAEAYLYLGKIHLRRGDIEAATSAYKTCVFWDNKVTEAYIALGKIFLDRNDCSQAQTYAKTALQLDPENDEVKGLQRLVQRCSK